MKLQTRPRPPSASPVVARGPFPWDLETRATAVPLTPRCPMCRFSGYVTPRGVCRRCGLELEEHRA